MKKVLIMVWTLMAVGAKAQESYYFPAGSSTYTASSSLPNWYLNLEKFWFYRYMLTNDFMLIGTWQRMRHAKGGCFCSQAGCLLIFGRSGTLIDQ